ncbi:MAG TPA: leucine--tRNA ligase [Anaerolineaceae bacterium]
MSEQPFTPYNPAEIETRWQTQWESDGLYQSNIDYNKPKYYALTMLPYPSGDLHIGHWYAMSPSDARARYKRMNGYNVLFPIGFDAFGLPAENAAIRRNIHPKEWTYANIANMRRQLRSMGAMFDWRREAVSSDPEYYRWTQWFFSQFYKAGLAYRKLSPVDWCPTCNTTLAREQVWGDDRHCERCGTPVIKKNLSQWFFRTTKYAEELLSYETIDWPDRVRTLQTNWIGNRSEGASVNFQTEHGDVIEVFTTRPDTLWGATFMVLAPEHPLVPKITTDDRKAEVVAYQEQATRLSDLQREAADKEKTGTFTGGYAINPVNGKRIPIWIADYVMMSYGTGAIMAVPAHDERDFAFALKFGLPIQPVIDRTDGLTRTYILKNSVKVGFEQALAKMGVAYQTNDSAWIASIPVEKVDEYIRLAQNFIQPGYWNEVVGSQWVFIFHDQTIEWDSVETAEIILSRCQQLEPTVRKFHTLMEMLWSNEYYREALYHSNYGTMINSGEFSGTPGDRAKKVVIEWLEQKAIGQGAVNYRLRDWLISRQRYWGAPIPMIYCPKCGIVPVPDEQLPVLLPDDIEWRPTGESPLKLHPTWRFTTCPKCGEKAERETDTMDTFMCSSWYHLRYLSPQYDQGPFDPKEYDYWMPVDTYTGGIEHANMHLIYTRFFHKACRDIGITKGLEPMIQLRNQGMVLGEDSEKMSKSRGNVVSPDDLVKAYGADVVRAYLMFFARWELGGPWSSTGIDGVMRWMRRVWAAILEPGIQGNPEANLIKAFRRRVHQTLRNITRDFETFEFNTIVSGLMELLNELAKAKTSGLYGSPAWTEAVSIYIRMLAPVAPHIAEELWARLGYPYSVHTQEWPRVDESATVQEEITLVLQVNGKVRDRLVVPADISHDEARKAALENPIVQRFLEGREARQVIYVPGKLVNVVG